MSAPQIIKWKEIENCPNKSCFRSDICFKTLNSKYTFKINLETALDKKAHQVYSYTIKGVVVTKLHKMPRSCPVIRSKKATSSYNKCVASIIQNIMEIIEKDMSEYMREHEKLVYVQNKMIQLHDFYYSNQTTWPPTCKK